MLGLSAVEHCGTLNLDRQRQVINPLGGIDDKLWDLSRETVVFQVSFDTTGYQGSVTHYVFMDTNDPQYVHIQLPIEGRVLFGEPRKESTTLSSPETKNLPLVRMSFFYSPGCRYCQKLRNGVFPQLGKKLRINLEVAAFSLSEPDNYQMLSLLEEEYQRQSNEIPVLVVGSDIG